MATIQENLELLKSTKNNIKQAIINKGVNVSDSDSFASYPSKIAQIQTGTTPSLQEKTIDIVQNGRSTVQPDGGYDGLSEVVINTNVPIPTPLKLQSKNYNIVQNGKMYLKREEQQAMLKLALT